jgi:hypothetical protein
VLAQPGTPLTSAVMRFGMVFSSSTLTIGGGTMKRLGGSLTASLAPPFPR